MSEKDIMIVSRKWPRRGNYTSVERFLDYFPEARIISSGNSDPKPYRLWHSIAGPVNRSAYSNWSARLEVSAMLAMLLHRPAIVHFFYGDHDCHFTPYIKKITGAKLAATFYFSNHELEERMEDKRYLKRLDLVLATGQSQKKYLEQFVAPEKTAFLPLGIDTEFFRPLPAYTFNASKPKVLQVGLNRRDFHMTKQVLSKLKDRFSGLEADMVGCAELKIMFPGEDWITWHPVIDDQALLSLYQSATLLLLAVKDGGSSNSLNEALACGLPVVTNRTPNLIDYTNSEGVICTDYDLDAMVKACIPLCSDPAYRVHCAEAARNYAPGSGIILSLLSLFS
jgi:glycosyltransferase involved in cell wall biosynthesis